MSGKYSDFGGAGEFSNLRHDPNAPSIMDGIQKGFARMSSILSEMHTTAVNSPEYKAANQKLVVARKAANKEFLDQMEANTRGIEPYTKGNFAPDIHKAHVEDLTKASISAGRKMIPTWLDRTRAYANNFMDPQAAADRSRLSMNPGTVGIMHPTMLPAGKIPAAELAVVHSLVSAKKAEL